MPSNDLGRQNFHNIFENTIPVFHRSRLFFKNTRRNPLPPSDLRRDQKVSTLFEVFGRESTG
jgi:hypothetical protein